MLHLWSELKDNVNQGIIKCLDLKKKWGDTQYLLVWYTAVRGTFNNLDGAWLEDETGVDLLEKKNPLTRGKSLTKLYISKSCIEYTSTPGRNQYSQLEWLLRCVWAMATGHLFK